MNILNNSTSSRVNILYILLLLLISELSVNAMPKKPSFPNEGMGPVLSSRFEHLQKNRNLNKPLELKKLSVSGTKKYLVILIRAKDKTNTFDSSSFKDMLFSDNTYSTGSLKDYFAEVSNNKLNVQGAVYGFYTAAQDYSYYVDGISGLGDYPKNAVKLVEEAIDAADSSGVDFSQYDNDGDGEVDGVFIVHQGAGAEAISNSGYKNYIWSHKWDIVSGGGTARKFDGVRINEYIMMPETNTDSEMIEIGVFCHEFGHLLGLFDLYDTDYSSSGSGVYDLMASGAWGADNKHPETPTHLSAWSKYYLGWANVYEYAVISGSKGLKPVEGSNDIIKINVEGNPNEYFLICNRQKTGFDKGLPGEGLLIWHVDEARIGSNKFKGSLNDNESAQSISLMEADGKFNLKKRYDSGGNDGDDGDFFPGSTGNTAFTSESAPSSNKNNGEKSDVSIVNIKSSTVVMSFIVGLISPPTDLKAIGIDDKIALRWKNPEFADYSRTFIIRKTDSYPASVNDGNSVYEGVDSAFLDAGITIGKTYYYTVISIDSTGNYSEPDAGSRAFAAVTLKAFNYPNPTFSGKTTIRYQMENMSGNEAVLYIFDISGELVLKIDNILINSNNIQPVTGVPVYDYSWDGRNGKGNQVSSGVYVFIIEAKDNIPKKDRTGKIAVIK